jgi:hypothetical protein
MSYSTFATDSRAVGKITSRRIRKGVRTVMAKGKRGTVSITAPGKKPIKFKKGKLHRQLGVPEDQPIPEGKKRAALSGRLGPEIKKEASFAFRGALAKGRETAAAHRSSSAGGAASRMSDAELDRQIARHRRHR